VAQAQWIDVAGVGASTPALIEIRHVIPLLIKAMGRQRLGRQRRQMCLPDAYGFPRTKGKGKSLVQGFRTGDIAKANSPTGTQDGTYIGRVGVRATGSCNRTTAQGTIQGLHAGYFMANHRVDGYAYQQRPSA
jgi:hypothetical protein